MRSERRRQSEALSFRKRFQEEQQQITKQSAVQNTRESVKKILQGSMQTQMAMTKMQKSMMILKILKKFEEGVLVAKENEIKNQWQFMADYNDLLLRLKQKKEANGKNGEYYSNLTEAQLNTSPSKQICLPLLTSKVVLERLDLNNSCTQNRLHKENELLSGKIKRAEDLLSASNRNRRSPSEWSQYVKSLELRIEKKKKDFEGKSYKLQQLKSFAETIPKLRLQLEQTHFRDVSVEQKEGQKERRRRRSSLSPRKPIGFKHEQLGLYLDQITEQLAENDKLELHEMRD